MFFAAFFSRSNTPPPGLLTLCFLCTLSPSLSLCLVNSLMPRHPASYTLCLPTCSLPKTPLVGFILIPSKRREPKNKDATRRLYCSQGSAGAGLRTHILSRGRTFTFFFIKPQPKPHQGIFAGQVGRQKRGARYYARNKEVPSSSRAGTQRSSTISGNMPSFSSVDRHPARSKGKLISISIRRTPDLFLHFNPERHDYCMPQARRRAYGVHVHTAHNVIQETLRYGLANAKVILIYIHTKQYLQYTSYTTVVTPLPQQRALQMSAALGRFSKVVNGRVKQQEDRLTYRKDHIVCIWKIGQQEDLDLVKKMDSF